jgi:hypothetical protein
MSEIFSFILRETTGAQWLRQADTPLFLRDHSRDTLLFPSVNFQSSLL